MRLRSRVTRCSKAAISARTTILCALPAAQANEIIADSYPKLPTLTADRVRAAVAEGRVRGYAFLDAAVSPGTAAVGVTIPALAPMAAISVAAISSRLDEKRRQSIAAELQRHAVLLGRILEGSMARSAVADV